MTFPHSVFLVTLNNEAGVKKSTVKITKLSTKDHPNYEK